MHWILVALLASALAGAATMANKYVFARVSRDPIVQTIAGGLVGVILSTVASYIYGFGSLSTPHFFVAILAGLCVGASLLLLLNAIKLGHVSQVGPLRFLTPVFVAVIAAVFLGESLELLTYAGIALVIVGAAFIEDSKPSAIKVDKFLGYMLASCLLLAVNQVLAKYLLEFSDPVTILVYVRIGLLLFILPLLVLHWRTLVAAIKPKPIHNSLLLTMGGIFGTSGMLLVIFAASGGPISIVSPLASTAPFFILLYVAILGRRFPDVYEDSTASRHLFRKVILSMVMFGGVLLIIA